MAELVRVSHSRIRAWRTCHKLHDYRHNQKLSPKRKPLPMKRGILVARLLELYYGKKDWKGELETYRKEFQKLWTEEQDLYGDLIGDVESIVKRYIAYYRDDGLKYVTVEKKWEFEYNGLMIVGRTDAEVKDENGKTWLLERKVPKKIPDEDTRFSDNQTVLYHWIQSICDNRAPYGIVWDYLRSKLPAVPDVLKSGELSQRKNMDTDQATYLKAIKDNELNQADYAEMLAHLEGNEEKFFYRVWLPRPSKKQVDIVVDEFLQSAFQIAELGEILTDRNPTRTCKSCEMYRLCRIESRGDDSNFIRKSEYTVETRDANQESAVEIDSDEEEES